MRSNFEKEFAFYIPHKFEEAKEKKFTGNQLGFYWINGDQLVTVTSLKNSWFKSNDDYFIWIYGMFIRNDRNNKDYAWLDSSYWKSILVGTDGYPTKDEILRGYHIAGGFKNSDFEATAIEFYGVKTQI